MHKLTAGVLVVLLVLGASALGLAQELYLPQVQYELEILELRSAEERALVLEAFEFQTTVDAEDFAFQLLSDGRLSGILGGLPFRLAARTVKEQHLRTAAPAVIVTLGQTASLKVVEETILPELSASGAHFRTRGVEIQVTPLMVDPAAWEIASAFVVQTYGEENAVRTTVLLQNGESLPLAIVRFTDEGNNQAEARYFAVFVRGEIIQEPPETAAFAIGGLGGLAKLLWPEEAALERQNYVWIALPVGPVDWPEGGFQLGRRAYLRGDFLHASGSPSFAAAGIALLPKGLDLELQILWHEGKAYAAVGVGDGVEVAPGVVLSGGWLPAVFDLDGFQRHKSLYWFGAAFAGRPLGFRFRLFSGLAGDSPTVQSEVEYTVQESLGLFVKLSLHSTKGSRISAGVRWTF